jgi:hypothetical protein
VWTMNAFTFHGTPVTATLQLSSPPRVGEDIGWHGMRYEVVAVDTTHQLIYAGMAH